MGGWSHDPSIVMGFFWFIRKFKGFKVFFFKTFFNRFFSCSVGTAMPLDSRVSVALELHDAAGDILKCNLCRSSRCLGC